MTMLSQKRSAPDVTRVWLLGGFRVSVGSRVLGDDSWRLRKAASLVKLLALSPDHRSHRERVMDILWPELDPRAATNNFHHVLHYARRTLQPANSPDASRYLLLREVQLALCPDAPLWVDVEAFQEASADARRAREPAAYRAAIDLYAGELLPEDRFEEWAEGRREELRRTYLDLLVELAGLHEERTEYEPAIEALRSVVAQEPPQEEAHAGLMRLYALAGRPREALRQYERLQKVLSDGFGRKPHQASRLLRDEIAAGRLPPSPALPGGSTPEEDPPSLSRHNLPAARTSFVNREREMLGLKRDLAMTRLLTLTGSGGTGKTRLALEVAKDLVGVYPDGVWLVELAGLSEPELLVQVVAATLRVRERPPRPLGATLAEDLRAKHLLLVLDNCEHLIEAVARFTDELLDACPKLRILATSREPLRVPGEVVRPVPPLPVPEPTDPALLTEGGLGRFAVTRLFLDRAHRRREEDSAFTGGRISEGSVQSVARVCRRLEGIPLAIELAAARTATLSLEQIEERLEDSLKLLTTGFRSADPRHQTLRATLDWSYFLLSEAERVLFRWLSVFAGGFTLEAAEAVGSGEGVGEGEVLDLLSRLVEKSLVALEEGERGVMRYTMLEPVRQYARQKLRESAEEDAVQGRHAEWCLGFAEHAEPKLSSHETLEWLDRIEAEHDNLRAALSWLLEQKEANSSLRLAAALWWFWYTHGHLGEGRGWLETCLSLSDLEATHTRARALEGTGWIAMFQGDFGAAKAFLQQSLALFRGLGDEDGIVSAPTNLGFVAVLWQRDLDTVPALLEEAMVLRPRLRDRRTIAYLLLLVGSAAMSRGDLEHAIAVHEESLAMLRETGDMQGLGGCLTNMGLMELGRDDHDRASELLREDMHVARGIDDKTIVHNALFGLAGVAARRGQPARAARLWGAAEAVREAFSIRLNPLARTVAGYEDDSDAARARLGEVAFEEAWAEGKAMTQEEAAEYALATEEPPPPPDAQEPSAPSRSAALTRREREISVLVGRVLTNRQICSELSVSERTVHNHIRNILSKLGLRSRTQIAVWAERSGLLP